MNQRNEHLEMRVTNRDKQVEIQDKLIVNSTNVLKAPSTKSGGSSPPFTPRSAISSNSPTCAAQRRYQCQLTSWHNRRLAS